MKKIIYIFTLSLLFIQCKKDPVYKDDITLEIKDFVWKGLNAYYLWKDEVPDLQDTRFKNQSDLNDFLEEFQTPDELFESLLYQRNVIDRWSWIVDDYVALENMFQGITKSTGMRYGLVYVPGSSTQIFAYVRYVVPDSPADKAGVKRGDIFRKINGTYLNIDNYIDLLNAETLNIELSQWQGDQLIDTGEQIYLIKEVITENPIYLTKIISHNGHKTGYLMYNNFVGEYDEELNDVFGYFLSNQIDELVLDLRYNSGGSVQTMQYLASMITGQFTGQKLLLYNWNNSLQKWYEENYPEYLYRLFTDQLEGNIPINHLRLNKIYILATGSSASASESLINCLDPYIETIHIGTNTHGKYTASVTLYDSPDFTKNNVNPDHNWAMQPIVLKISNAQGISDFYNGLTPDIFLPEDYRNLGILGDTEETLLHEALLLIEGKTVNYTKKTKIFDEIFIRQKQIDEAQYLDYNIPLPPR